MEKILKHLHWFIIAYAAFELYTLYSEANERLVNIESQQEVRRAELSKNKKIQREITNYYKNIEEEKVKIERVAREIEKMQQLLPSEISDSDNISLLRRMADDVNIKELSIAPEIESDRGFYIARRYRIKAKATFLQFLIMFEKIAENKRILNVGESSFKKSELPQRSKFQVIEGDVVIEAYRYNASFKEDRGIDEIEQQFKDGKKQGAPNKRPRAVKEDAE
jgi:Tfp pilus assembly protein PilO